MVPATFTGFFAASAGAAAALIGLLFVAVSVRPELVFGEQARAENTLMASASFTALLNAFFISLGALIPGTNLGLFVVVVAPVAILNSLALGVDIFRETDLRARFQSIPLVLVGLLLYGYELENAALLFRNPNDISPVYNVAGVLLGVYMYGVARAWQLLGANRRGVLSLIVPWGSRKKPVTRPVPHENGPTQVPLATSPDSAKSRAETQ